MLGSNSLFYNTQTMMIIIKLRVCIRVCKVHACVCRLLHATLPAAVSTLRLKPQPLFELVWYGWFWIPGGYHILSSNSRLRFRSERGL